MEFSEANRPWKEIPNWVLFLLKFGYAWVEQASSSRRIAVISMPADSAAAGLIALGAIRKYMEMDDANDVTSHFERLRAFAQTPPHQVRFRRINHLGKYRFIGMNQDGYLMVKKENAEVTQCILKQNAYKWHVDGESPVVLPCGQKIPNQELYENILLQGGLIVNENLSRSHSELCLTSKPAGEAPTKRCMSKFRFRRGGEEVKLSELLTVQSWTPGTISRVLFYNSLKQKFDRQVGAPKTIIADGDTSFLKIISNDDFIGSNVIGIIHRTMERSRLEFVSDYLGSQSQWYEPVEPDGLPQTPRGIGLFMLERRQM